MKTLKTFLFSVLLVGFIACSNSVGPEQGFEPYRVGTFMFHSPDSANWVGSQQKTLATTTANDTIVISSSGNKNISLVTTENKEMFDLIYVDSTLDFHKVNNQNINISDTELNLPEPQNNTVPFTTNGTFRGAYPNYLKFKYSFGYNCDAVLEQGDIIGVQFYKNDGKAFRYYRFKTVGFEDAIRDLVCN